MSKQAGEQRARRLVDQIMADARADDYRALLKIDADSDTPMLLRLLPDEATRTAKVHLRGARLWRDQQNEKARDRLSAVKIALDGLDVPLAKGLLGKVDSSILGDSELAWFDELLLATEARAAELEDIQGRIPSSSPEEKPKRRRR
jgi:hypothetical protein